MGYNSKRTGAEVEALLDKVDQLSSSSGKIPVIDHGTSDTTFELTAGVVHKWGAVPSLNLTLPQEEEGFIQQYKAIFRPMADFMLTLPSTLQWPVSGIPIITEGTEVEMNIEENRVLISSFKQIMEAGDIIYYDGAKLAAIKKDAWSESLGTAVAVIVAPASMSTDGKIRAVHVAGSRIQTVWGVAGTDVSSLPNYQKVRTTDNQSHSYTGTSTGGYLPSDSFEGEVSFTDAHAKYSGNTPFIPSPYDKEGLSGAYIGDIDGSANTMSDFSGKSSSYVLAELDTSYSAAYSCNNVSVEGAGAGNWYLPAAGEVALLLARKKVINETLELLGYNQLPNDRIWTSSEYGGTYANAIDLSNGQVVNVRKSDSLHVIPFISLSL